MSPEEADKRIILSRTSLHSYVQMVDAGVDPAPGTLMLVHDEIGILEGIAEAHPGKVSKLVRLVSEWVAFREGLRAKLN